MEAWALVSASWLVRATALTLLLAALGLGFTFPLAMMFLCAGAAAAALPIALGGAATQIGAGATLLIVSGIGTTEALGFALAAQTLLILSGAAVLFLAVTWKTSPLARRRQRPVSRRASSASRLTFPAGTIPAGDPWRLSALRC